MREKKSIYKGVSFRQQSLKWVSTVSYKGKVIHCGSFDTDREAVVARDKVILKEGFPKSKLQIFTPDKK